LNARFLRLFPALQPDALRRFEIYADLLGNWQKRINLVGPSTVADLWVRHFADSLQLLPLAGLWKNWVDLGSGAGFPGMVVAIGAGERAKVVHLIESDKKKVAFLREVSRETRANVEIHQGRIESIFPALSNAIQCDVVSARALAPLSSLIAYAQPALEKGAVGLFLKGKEHRRELTAELSNSSFEIKLIDSRTEAGAKIVQVARPNSRTNSI